MKWDTCLLVLRSNDLFSYGVDVPKIMKLSRETIELSDGIWRCQMYATTTTARDTTKKCALHCIPRCATKKCLCVKQELCLPHSIFMWPMEKMYSENSLNFISNEVKVWKIEFWIQTPCSHDLFHRWKTRTNRDQRYVMIVVFRWLVEMETVIIWSLHALSDSWETIIDVYWK